MHILTTPVASVIRALDADFYVVDDAKIFLDDVDLRVECGGSPDAFRLPIDATVLQARQGVDAFKAGVRTHIARAAVP